MLFRSVLVVDDEESLAQGFRFNLEADGHEVVVAASGEDALDLIVDQQATFDVIVLDVMLPGKDGFTVANELRAAGQFVPILMLTARGRPEDVLKGFAAGADDYLPKPFELTILLARVNGLLRRRSWNDAQPPTAAPVQPPSTPDVYAFAGRTMDFSAMQLHARDRSYHLTLMECNLLRYLVAHAGQPVSRRTILQEVWGLDEDTDTRAIDNFIVRLRQIGRAHV